MQPARLCLYGGKLISWNIHKLFQCAREVERDAFRRIDSVITFAKSDGRRAKVCALFSMELGRRAAEITHSRQREKRLLDIQTLSLHHFCELRFWCPNTQSNFGLCPLIDWSKLTRTDIKLISSRIVLIIFYSWQNWWLYVYSRTFYFLQSVNKYFSKLCC